MSLAEIFRPIRSSRPTPPQDAALSVSLRERAGLGETPPPDGVTRTTNEEGWLALLELVFDETGWPDAE